MVLDTDALFGRRCSLCGSHDDCRDYVRPYGDFAYRYCFLHGMALPALGDKTVVESFCRHFAYASLVDCCHAVFAGSGNGRRCVHVTSTVFLSGDACIFLAYGIQFGTHDIAADGFYMLALSTHEQSFFVGIRSTFYRIAMIAGQGLLVMVAGQLEIYTRVEVAWSLTFGAMALLFVVFAVYHLRVLPHPQSDKVGTVAVAVIWREFVETFVSFFRKPGIGIALLFLLTYRLAEAQLVKLASLFLLDEGTDGGLALTTAQVGFVYGTVGVIALTVGGIVGGWAVSRYGLRRCLWPMALALTLPNLVYLYLSLVQPSCMIVVNVCVAVEQLGYGFGFTAYMLYMIAFSEGKHATAHYALCTAFMALGMMLPGMVAGWIADHMGYVLFFIWIMICTVPVFIVLPFLKIPGNFGLKERHIGR